MIEVGILGAAGLFTLGLVTGLLLRGPGQQRQDTAARPLSRPETPEESLARLTVRSSVRKGSGQVVMGPQQPRPQVQDRIPAAPPRRGVQGGSVLLPPPPPPRRDRVVRHIPLG